MKTALAVAFVLLLAGCATLHDELKPWMGETKGSLIVKWGPPLDVRSDGQGGTILHYYRANGHSSAHIYMYAHRDGALYYYRFTER